MNQKNAIIRMMAMGIVTALATSANAAVYAIDQAHSTIGFSVRHMLVANVQGNFGSFSGEIHMDPAAPSEVKAKATIEVKSINTNNERRDEHLRADDFFDAANFPEIAFETTASEGALPNLVLVGNLTMRGVTREIRLPVEFSGPVVDPWGNERIGFSGRTEINRQDYGISWSNTLDGGGLVVSDTVRLIIDVQGIKQ